MIKSGFTDKQIAVVVTFTGYTDGSVDFIQAVPDKRLFNEVRDCMRSMMRSLRNTVADQGKCPFNPDNLKEYVLTETGGTVAVFEPKKTR